MTCRPDIQLLAARERRQLLPRRSVGDEVMEMKRRIALVTGGVGGIGGYRLQ
jgi:hypothetical protein